VRFKIGVLSIAKYQSIRVAVYPIVYCGCFYALIFILVGYRRSWIIMILFHISMFIFPKVFCPIRFHYIPVGSERGISSVSFLSQGIFISRPLILMYMLGRIIDLLERPIELGTYEMTTFIYRCLI